MGRRFSAEEVKKLEVKEPPRVFSKEQVEKLEIKPKSTSFSGLFARGADTAGAVEGLKRGAIEAIPLAGGLAGGAIGSSAGPVGAVVGAGLGSGAGKSLQNALKAKFYPEEAPKSLSEGLQSVAKEAALGAVGEGTGQVLGKAATGLGKYAVKKLSDMSDVKAIKAAGAMLKDMRQIYGANKVEELAKTLRENEIVTPLSTFEDVYNRSSSLAKKTGLELDDIYNNIKTSTEKIKAIDDAGFKPVSDSDAILSEFKKEFKGKVGYSTALKKLEGYLDDIAANGDDITPSKAREIRQDVDNNIKYEARFNTERDWPLVQKGLHQLRTFINKKILDQADLVASLTDSNAGEELRRLNKLSSNLSDIVSIAKDRKSREAANQTFGLSEKLAAGSGASAGAYTGFQVGGIPGAITGFFTGATTGLIAKAIRTYGNPAVSEATQLAKQMIENSPRLRVLAKQNPAIITQTALNLLVERGQPLEPQNEPQRVQIPAKPELNITPVQRRLLLRGQ